MLLCIPLLLWLITSSSSSSPNSDCSLYLAPSKSFPGRGIITSKSIDEGTVIDFSAITLPVPLSKITTSQLNNYVYASEEDYYAMCIFGMAMIFNHMRDDDYTAHHYWDTSENITTVSEVLRDPYSSYTTVSYSIRDNATVKSGYEIFASYGDDSWFSERGINQMNTTASELPVYSVEELEEIGHCLTHAMVFDSDIPLSGKGLFAMRDFRQGEIVDISPVLVLRKHDVESIANESLLMNYCITSPSLDVVLLPLGFGAAINHNTESLSNLQMEWYEWPSNLLKSPTKDSNLDDLLKSEFSQLDISFRAKRFISYGEELTINYGVEWIEEWASYLASIYQEAANNITANRLFRHPIIARPDFFPQHWYQSRKDEL